MRQTQKNSQKMFSVYVVRNGNVRGRYLRYRTAMKTNGSYFHKPDFVGSKDDATLFLRFEDARRKALEVKSLSDDASVFVAEILPEKIGKTFPVKEKT